MLGFRVKLSLLVFFLLPVLVSLGIWQLSRYQEKQALEVMYENRRQLSPVTLPELASWSDPLYIPLKVEGHFDADRYFLRDNQIWQGQVGYELIMPFLTTDGQWLLVNRGWIPMIRRDIFPDISTNTHRQTIEGIAYRSFGKPFLLAEDQWTNRWPKVIQAVDFQRMGDSLGAPVAAVTLILNQGLPDTEQVRPIIVNMKSEKHLGYALQWFSMALVLMGLYIYRMRGAFRANNTNSRSA